ncbi:spore coat protein [Ureibacillus aquaedulcis]|uniref:Spore coat protein n=1 Tax=Ureibacillus aquaedulcis TaxID=3058421 RepID=A0ABT8GQ44_9BACL|nr:spore coat protein [Ureibacillus sp. BA0131]MDN4493542.1 spore coat protein [Ureibacillus sp. BA0131]
MSAIPNKVVDLLVSEIFRKNNVNIENAKSKLTDEQKQAIRDLVDELKSQVDTFVKESSSSTKE